MLAFDAQVFQGPDIYPWKSITLNYVQLILSSMKTKIYFNVPSYEIMSIYTIRKLKAFIYPHTTFQSGVSTDSKLSIK